MSHFYFYFCTFEISYFFFVKFILYFFMQAIRLLDRGLKDGNFEGFIDPRLQDNYDKQEMTRMAVCAVYSIERSENMRPTMQEVWLILFWQHHINIFENIKFNAIQGQHFGAKCAHISLPKIILLFSCYICYILVIFDAIWVPII